MWRVSKSIIATLCELGRSLHTGQLLDVSITTSPPGVMHQASSSLNLTCSVSGCSRVQSSYQWTSTCTGNCFVLGGRSPNLVQTALHSADSGNHTCLVADVLGNHGMATVQIFVVGKFIIKEYNIPYVCVINAGVGINYLGVGLLENNTLVTADADQTINDLHCSSGSTIPSTGRWIAPNGDDLTNSTVDPFRVIQGDEHDPGSLIIQQASGHIITNSFQGVYTCILPDENAAKQYVHVGIYQNGFSCELMASTFYGN